MLRVIFLGTGGALPTTNRNPSAIFVNMKGDSMLFDCGEGTQQQMMRAKTGMTLESIFITHWHGDHFLGIPGLIQTMSFQGRTKPLEILGPKDIDRFVSSILALGYYRLKFQINIRELSPGDVVDRDGYKIKVFNTDHSIPSIGFILEENERLGRFNREKAIELGVKPGPIFSKLHSGESVIVDGREIRSGEVVGPPRKGRKIVYSGDTRPCDAVIEASRGADLLIYDGMLSEELKDWAIESKHSTALEAAKIAKKAGVNELILTHISSRYSEDPRQLLKEAKSIFNRTKIARDLMITEVPYRDGD
ncbi:MAG: ribonuclease Z [Halobacteriota archaeon]|nr:ribonuclease Z [Halobacteriota archaeon]